MAGSEGLREIEKNCWRRGHKIWVKFGELWLLRCNLLRPHMHKVLGHYLDSGKSPGCLEPANQWKLGWKWEKLGGFRGTLGDVGRGLSRSFTLGTSLRTGLRAASTHKFLLNVWNNFVLPTHFFIEHLRIFWKYKVEERMNA